MKAKELREHCKRVATWVNWEKTCDQFMHGDPEAEVKGIAVTWLATNPVLKQAARQGLNVVVAHEGAFYPQFKGTESEERHHRQKRKLIDELGVTLMRCHDTWDRMPGIGIPDAWADFLGFDSEPRDTQSFYKICKVNGRTVEEVARRILEKTKPLGQRMVRIMGDTHKTISRLAIGTGAITNPALMHQLDADSILATDDGIQTTSCGLWAVDLDIPVLIVDHPTAELPGMMALATYIGEQFPGIPVSYLPCRFPCEAVL
ncbi:MAG: Nif3-like dinuclear metal center hexameric protein [Kiritimatiellae bacterium]|nr:Nif3-like dinuclear metal center hexameric protein [Kiritimatiellia bacterium]